MEQQSKNNKGIMKKVKDLNDHLKKSLFGMK